MADLQIGCVTKRERQDPTERITHVGGSWGRKTSEEAIADIENGRNSFYVRVGSRVNVVVATSRLGNKYLKTEPDDAERNNLLSLSPC